MVLTKELNESNRSAFNRLGNNPNVLLAVKICLGMNGTVFTIFTVVDSSIEYEVFFVRCTSFLVCF